MNRENAAPTFGGQGRLNPRNGGITGSPRSGDGRQSPRKRKETSRCHCQCIPRKGHENTRQRSEFPWSTPTRGDATCTASMPTSTQHNSMISLADILSQPVITIPFVSLNHTPSRPLTRSLSSRSPPPRPASWRSCFKVCLTDLSAGAAV